jgi:hypothetical protein
MVADMLSPLTKICTRCKHDLPMGGYYMHSTGKYYARCKTCCAEVAAGVYAQNKEKLIAKSQAYYRQHRAEALARNAEWKAVNRERVNENARKHRAKSKTAQQGSTP